MKNYLKIMLSAIMLMMATQGYGSVKYDYWRSTNYAAGSSESNTWLVKLKAGEALVFYWYKNIESYNSDIDKWTTFSGDKFYVTLNGTNVVEATEDWNQSDTYTYTAPVDMVVTIQATFVKGYSGTNNEEYGEISNMYVLTHEDLNQTHDVQDIVVGHTFGLGSNFYDSFSGISYCDFTWTSSNNNVVEVTDNCGWIKAIGTGTATVTATDSQHDTGMTQTFNIRVVDVLDVPGYIQLENISYSDETWTSGDESIAIVGRYGTVIGLKEGTTTITRKYGSNGVVTYPIRVTQTSIDINGCRSLENIFYNFKQCNATSWSSADESIAKVGNYNTYWYEYDPNYCHYLYAGDVYGWKIGSTTITATGTKDGEEVNMTFPINVKSVGISVETESEDLDNIFFSLTGKSGKLTSSANEDVAFIYNSSVIGASEGSTTITVTATDDSGVSIDFPVKVTNPYVLCTEEAPVLASGFTNYKVYSSPNSVWTYNGDNYYGINSKPNGTLIYKINIPERKFMEIEYIRPYTYSGEVSISVDYSQYYYYSDKKKFFLYPGDHSIRVNAYTYNDAYDIPFAGISFGYRILYSEYTYAEASQGVEMDIIHLEREGTLGGEALKLHDNLSDFKGLCVSGPFDEYDWKSLAEMTNLQVLDMEEVEAASYPTKTQNNNLRAVRFSKHIPDINYNPFQSIDYAYVPDEVTRIGNMTTSTRLFSLEGCLGVKEIGDKAFSNVAFPQTLSMPNVEKIGRQAFEGQKWLRKIEFPNVLDVLSGAFAKCTSLNTVIMPKVKEIGSGAFVNGTYNYDEKNNTYTVSPYNTGGNLVNISIPEVEKIYGHAFYYQSNLNDFEMPQVSYIGKSAFYSCSRLRSINSPNLTSLADYSFTQCTFLSNIEMPNITSMGYAAFRGCTTLTSVDMPNLTSMGNQAFSKCTALTSASMPNLTSVPVWAFAENSKLASVDIRRATDISRAAFKNCSRLATANLSKAETIADSAFYACKLSEINLPNVTSLGSRAFYNNTAATSIDLSDKLTAIGEMAFYGCTGVEHLTLPASLTELPSNCFSGSNNIKTISVNAPAPPAVGETPFTMQTLYTATLRVPSASMGLYQAHDYWKHFYYWEENPSQLTDLVLATDLNLGTVRMDKASVTINPGISLTMGGNDAQPFRNVLLKSTGSQTGMLLSNCERITSDQTSVELSMTGLKWYFISLPFDVTISDIQNSEGAQLAIHRYDGATRASQGTGSSWVRQRTGTLSRGKGYIIQASKATTLTLPATYETKDAPFLPYDVTFTLEENASQTAANQGWNFVGNPYPTYFDIAQLGYSAPITVWTGSTYAAYSPEDDDLALAPLQPFFVQRPSGVESLTLNAQGRQTTSVISHPTEVKTMQPKANGRKVVDIVLTDGQQTDRTRIVVNPLATDGYDLTCDAAKMMSMEADVPQLYSHRDGVDYAINEGPQETGEVELTLVVPTAGSYTLRATRSDVQVVLTDLLTGESMVLDSEGYAFEAEAGTCDDRFVVILISDEETGIANEMVNGQSSNGKLIYDLTGKRLNRTSRGVNIVRQGTNVTKQLSR